MRVVLVLAREGQKHAGLPKRLMRDLAAIPREGDDVFLRIDDRAIEREVTLWLTVVGPVTWAAGTTQSLPYVAARIREVVQESNTAWKARWQLTDEDEV